MIENTKCECGHQNPIDTLLCEACGKPLKDDDGQSPLEMRYDGVARRSQRSNPGWINRVWNFFSSVKIAVYLIIVTLLGATLGTIYPQENTFYNTSLINFKEYYTEQYGLSGKIYYMLGLSHTYESWWFRGLLIMIGASLVICSLDRVLPLYRALSKQQVRKHLRFITRQRVKYETDLDVSNEDQAREWVDHYAKALRKSRYKVHTDGTALLAEKNRFSRWGPYVNHIGLIIFLLAALLRSINPSWSTDINLELLDGQTKQIPNTPYFIKNEQFTVEFYEEDKLPESFIREGKMVPSLFKTEAVLYECVADCDNDRPELKEVARHDIIVNDPMKYKNMSIYQFHYEVARNLISMNVTLEHRETKESFGQMSLDMLNPQSEYAVGPYNVTVEDYYPDLTIRDGQPATKSRNPKNPAFIFSIAGPELAPEGVEYLFVPMLGIMREIGKDDIELSDEAGGMFDISIASEDDVQISNYETFLNVRSERGMSYIWIGAAISMIGLIMGFYWQHRRIWLRIDGNAMALGAYTNKNWFAMRSEVAATLARVGIEVDAKLLDNGGEKA